MQQQEEGVGLAVTVFSCFYLYTQPQNRPLLLLLVVIPSTIEPSMGRRLVIQYFLCCFRLYVRTWLNGEVGLEHNCTKYIFPGLGYNDCCSGNNSRFHLPLLAIK